jgi:hypothetical protein
MYRAVDEKKPQVVSYVLALGLKLERLAIERALDVKSVDIFQAFIDNGWDINAPLGELESPPLAYVLPSALVPPSFSFLHICLCNALPDMLTDSSVVL